MATAAVTYTFVPNTTVLAAEANTNFDDLVSFLNTSVMHRDASSAFTNIPSGPSTDPSSDNQFTRKAYVDEPYAMLQTDTTFFSDAGVQGPFASFSTLASRSITTSSSRITLTEDGTYCVGAGLFLASNTAGVRGVMVRKNGSNLIGNADEADDTTGFGKFVGVTFYEDLTAGDYLDLLWKQDSGSALAGRIMLWAWKVHGTS